MKKLLLVGLLCLGIINLIGCTDIKDGPGMEREPDDNEWFAVAEGYCEDEGGQIEMWEEGGENQPVCFYEEDGSFCYLEELYDGICSKGEIYYFEDYDIYSYAEEVCMGNNGQVSTTDEGESICILSDEEFCYIDDIIDGGCDLLYQDIITCTEEYDPVCGVDGNTYSNRCFLEAAGVEEEIELAEVIDGECVFG